MSKLLKLLRRLLWPRWVTCREGERKHRQFPDDTLGCTAPTLLGTAMLELRRAEMQAFDKAFKMFIAAAAAQFPDSETAASRESKVNHD